MDEKQIPIDILLVEDDMRDAELTIRALKKHHIINNIHHVKDGDEAIHYFFDGDKPKNFQKPKLILLDLKLPKVSGVEVLRKLKSNANTKILPVTVLTSSKEESDLKKCYELGVNSYIVKPVEFEKFVKAIEEIGLYWLLLNQSPPMTA